MIYFDNASTTKVLPEAADAALSAMCDSVRSAGSVWVISTGIAFCVSTGAERVEICTSPAPVILPARNPRVKAAKMQVIRISMAACLFFKG